MIPGRAACPQQYTGALRKQLLPGALQPALQVARPGRVARGVLPLGFLAHGVPGTVKLPEFFEATDASLAALCSNSEQLVL